MMRRCLRAVRRLPARAATEDEVAERHGAPKICNTHSAPGGVYTPEAFFSASSFFFFFFFFSRFINGVHSKTDIEIRLRLRAAARGGAQ